jgi:hypothetical protein
VVVAAALLALSSVAGVTAYRAHAPEVTGRPGGAAALPSRVYVPSGWLPTDDDPPGQLSLVIPTEKTHLTGYTWALVGVSATTGAYGFLDLPDYAAEGALSPDGRHLAYYLGTGQEHQRVVDGLAVYDTGTGDVTRWQPTPGRPLNLQDLSWNGNDALTFTLAAGGVGKSYSWRFGHGAPRPTSVALGHRVGVAGNTGLYVVGHRHYRYLSAAGPAQNLRLAWPYRTIATPLAVSPSGRWVAAVHATQRVSRLLVGRVAAPRTRTTMHAVRATGIRWPYIIGWSDDRHLVVVDQVFPRGYDGEGIDSTRYALDRIDVRTGQVVQLSDVGRNWGATVDYATGLLGAPTRDFPAPPRPWGPRVELGLLSAIVLVAVAALVVWRRRARA